MNIHEEFIANLIFTMLYILAIYNIISTGIFFFSTYRHIAIAYILMGLILAVSLLTIIIMDILEFEIFDVFIYNSFGYH